METWQFDDRLLARPKERVWVSRLIVDTTIGVYEHALSHNLSSDKIASVSRHTPSYAI